MPCVYSEWKQCTVGLDDHVEVDRHYDAAPHGLLRETVWVRLAARTVEIFHNGKRVAAHARTSSDRGHTTIADHMPASHRRHAEWSPARLTRGRLKARAAKIGPDTTILVEVILRDRSHPEQGFRSCLGILRLSKSHGARRRWKPPASKPSGLERAPAPRSTRSSETICIATGPNRPRRGRRSSTATSAAPDTSIETGYFH